MSLVTTSLKSWREEIGRQLLHLDFEAIDDAPFRAVLDPVLANREVCDARSEMSAGITFRDPGLCKDGTDTISLVIATKGTIHVEHQKHSCVLRPGEATLLENFEPGRLGANTTFAFRSVVLPSAVLGSLGQQSRTVISSRIRGESLPLKLLRSYLTCIERAGRTSGTTADVSARHISELAALVIYTPRAGAATAAVGEARCAIAMRYLAENFRDSALDLPAVAAHQGVSVRYLQRVLEASGLGYSQRLIELRLEEACRLLQDPRARGMSITDIALASGFSDISHFNRAFRRRFGETPTQMRG